MKKITIALALALVSAVAFFSCDMMKTLMGSATLVLTDANGGTYYAPDGPSTDTVDFSSCVCDIISIMDDSISTRSFLSVGANIDLTENDAISYPYFGVLLADTNVGTIEMSSLSLNDFYRLRIGNALTSFANFNLVAIAASDTSWYISNGGSINVTAFATNGQLSKADFNNVDMKYVRKSQIIELSNLMDRAAEGDATAIATLATITIDTYFPSVTLNGNYSSRRMNILGLVDNLGNE